MLSMLAVWRLVARLGRSWCSGGGIAKTAMRLAIVTVEMLVIGPGA